MNFLRFGQQGGQTDKPNHAIFSVQQKLTHYAVISATTNKPLLHGSLSPAQLQVQKSQTHMQISLLRAQLLFRIPDFRALVKVEKRWYNRKEVDFLSEDVP